MRDHGPLGVAAEGRRTARPSQNRQMFEILRSSDPQILRSSDPQILKSSNPQILNFLCHSPIWRSITLLKSSFGANPTT